MAATTDIERLAVLIEANTKSYENAMKKLQQQTDAALSRVEGRFGDAQKRIEQTLNRGVAGAMTGFAKGLIGGALGALSLGAISEGALRAVADLAKIGDVADRVGITAEQLQELRFALEQSGGEAAQAGTAMERFANNIAKAMEGEGDLGKFLVANNVALKDRAGQLRPTAELLSEVANLIQNAKSPQEQLNIAVEFFGRQAGPAMAAALKNGAAGLVALGVEARKAGTVLENEVIKKAQEIDDNFQKLARTISTQFKGAVVDGATALERFTAQLSIAGKIQNNMELSAEELASAIALARSKGSPVDPSWIVELERLLEIRRELNRGKGFGGLEPPKFTSALPATPNTGKLTDTRALHGVKDEEESKSAFDRAIAQAEKRTAVLEAETGAINDGTAARESAKLVAELETAAKQANKDAGLENTEVTAQQRIEIDRLAASYLEVAKRAEEAKGPLASAARSATDMADNLQKFSVSSVDHLATALTDIADGSKTAAEAFSEFAKSALRDLTQMLIKAMLWRAVMAATGSVGTAANANPFPFPINGNPFPTPIGSNATGTNFWRGGPTWVGERGKEIVDVPRGARITPNRDIMPKVNVNVRNYGGAEVEIAQPRRSAGGDGFDLDVLVTSKVNRSLASGGSDAPMTRFGGRVAPVRR